MSAFISALPGWYSDSRNPGQRATLVLEFDELVFRRFKSCLGVVSSRLDGIVLTFCELFESRELVPVLATLSDNFCGTNSTSLKGRQILPPFTPTPIDPSFASYSTSHAFY